MTVSRVHAGCVQSTLYLKSFERELSQVIQAVIKLELSIPMLCDFEWPAHTLLSGGPTASLHAAYWPRSVMMLSFLPSLPAAGAGAGGSRASVEEVAL